MPSKYNNLYIAAMGMITPVGADPTVTTMAIRAGISALRASDHVNKQYEPIIMALVPDATLPPLHDDLWHANALSSRNRRMLRLASPALQQCLEAYAYPKPLALLLAGPETLPRCPPAIDARFIDQLIHQSGATLHRQNCRLVATGRAGGLHVIELAYRYLEETDQEYVLVGGIDSYQDRFVLGYLDHQNRVLATGVKDGFAPGEAVGFLVLATEQGLAQLGATPKGIVYRPVAAKEPGHYYSSQPYRGEGLASAFRLALEQRPGEKIRTVYSSMNGESHWAKEYGVAMTRCSDVMDAKVRHAHPGDCIGDIGAAFGPVMVGVATMGIQGSDVNSTSLVYCSSDTEHRAAVRVQSIH